jgi:predicted permease
MLSLLGGLLGVLLAYWGVRGLKAILPGTVPRVAGIQMDPAVLGFAALVTAATGLFFGLAPALVSSRTDLVSDLAGRAGRAGGRSRNRFLASLVVVQLAIGFVLVNAAAVLLASYDNVISQRLNFETEKTLVAGISATGPAYEEPQARLAFFQDLRERVRALPGVVAVGITTKLPLRGGSNGGVLVKDQVFDPTVERELVEHSFVDDGYHQAMGIALLAGRTLHQGDLDHAAVAAGLDVSPVELPLVINRTMAEKLWPGESAIGQVVRNNGAEDSYRARVVGVVEDVRQWGAEREPLPEMYFPYTAEVWGAYWAAQSKLVVRAGGDPRPLVSSIRVTLHQVDPHVPLADVATMGEVVHLVTGHRRFSVLLVGLFALTALILNVAGLYGVMSYAVTQRTHEIGVRVALGSSRARLFRLFLAGASRQLLAGLAVGLAGALAAATTLRGMVYDVSVWNPTFMLVAAAVIVPVAFVAVLVPVARAARVDPVAALRNE